MNIKRKLLELIFNTVILLILVRFVYHSYYELFIRVPRVNLGQDTWGNTMVNFTLDTPTKTNFVILISGFLSILTSLVIYTIRIFNLNVKTKKYWIIISIGFIICLISIFVAISDFMGSAFEGVG